MITFILLYEVKLNCCSFLKATLKTKKVPLKNYGIKNNLLPAIHQTF